MNNSPAATASASAGEATLLSVSHLSVSFGGVDAVRDVSFDIRHGQMYGLIGPNGAGKTTTFNAITGFVKPTKGVVHFEGRDISSMAPHARSRIGLRRTFQDTELFDDLTVAENLGVGMTRNQRSQIDGLIDALGLGKHGSTMCRDLPGGVRREVGVARALASGPKLLLLDEPGAGLVHEEVEVFGQRLSEVSRQFGCAVLVVDHDMTLIRGVCESVYVLDFGSLIACGSVHDVLQDERVREAYLGV